MLESLLARPRVLVCACLLAGAGVLAIHPTWAQVIGADVWNLPALKEQLRAAQVEDDRLTDDAELAMQRIATKETIVSELLAGRTTLDEATDRFLEMSASRPELIDALRKSHTGATDREIIARNVIAFALPRATPEARPALSSRLEGELRQALADASH